MLSVKSISAGDSGATAKYYEDLASEDYYTAGGEPPGKWVGEYADSLGLAGTTVAKGELAQGMAGNHPRTGEAIANNAGEDHKPGHDLTFSAPKSVSVVWITASDEQRRAISEAQQKAVESALQYVSQNALHTREGHAGADHIPYRDGIACATFEHSTSRNGDPQLHTHAILLNINETGKRVDFDTNFKMSAGAFYRAELAASLQKMGYEIERDGKSFKIAGVPDALTKELSTRRAEIEAKLAETGLSGGKASAAAALDTRQSKGEVNRAELVQQSRETAAKYGFSPEALRSNEPKEPKQFDIEEFKSDLTERASTLTTEKLDAFFYEKIQGTTARPSDLDAIKRDHLIELTDKKNGSVRWTTEEILTIETRIADTAGKMQGEKTHAIKENALNDAVSTRTLSDDQLNALKHITAADRIGVVQGIAGAGKSYMLDAAREAWEKSGYQVIGAALAGKAAEGLKKSSGINTETLHATNWRIEHGKIQLTDKTVIVIDEAGMVGSRQMDKLMQFADAAGAKVVLVGDIRQLQPIDAGGAMRAVQERVGYAEMNEVRRQIREEDRAIVKDLAEARVGKALHALEENGSVVKYNERNDAIHGAAMSVVTDLQEGKSSFAMAGMRVEVAAINCEARESAKEAGLVTGEDVKYQAENKHIDEFNVEHVEKEEKSFAVGDRLVFCEKDRDLGVENGTTGTVTEAESGRLTVRLDDTEKTVTVTDDDYKQISHGYSMTVHKSQGVTVDRAHYLPGHMSKQELNYVALSRHRESVKIHADSESYGKFKENAIKEDKKDLSTDHQIVEKSVERNQRDQHEKTHDLSEKKLAVDTGIPGRDKNAANAIVEPVMHEREAEAVRLVKPDESRFERQHIEKTDEKHSVKDAKLARAALQTTGKMPKPDKIKKMVERGEARWTRDSKGEKYLVTKKGETFHKDLHSKKTTTDLHKLGLGGDKKALIIDKHLIDFKFAGKRVQFIKTGTQVLISRDTLVSKWAGQQRDAMRERHRTDGKGGLLQRVNDQVKDNTLKGFDKYRKATFTEAIRARVSIMVENGAQKKEAIEIMKEKIAFAAKSGALDVHNEKQADGSKSMLDVLKEKLTGEKSPDVMSADPEKKKEVGYER